LRSTWPEKNEDDKFLTLSPDNTSSQNGIFIDRGEIRRRIRAVPLSKLLGLDEDEYRRELGELDNDNGDDSNSNRRRNGTKGEEKTKKETTGRKKEEEAMLDSLLGDDDDDDDD
tara:strand:+ start:904 stop:1245 length:342 start_codon:yes stop_codon:yes gene_type:complete